MKWRKISRKELVNVSETDKWHCCQNSDPNFSTCDVPEEDVEFYDQLALRSGLKYLKSELAPGALVWAKMHGYCRYSKNLWPPSNYRRGDGLLFIFYLHSCHVGFHVHLLFVFQQGITFHSMILKCCYVKFIVVKKIIHQVDTHLPFSHYCRAISGIFCCDRPLSWNQTSGFVGLCMMIHIALSAYHLAGRTGPSGIGQVSTQFYCTRNQEWKCIIGLWVSATGWYS